MIILKWFNKTFTAAHAVRSMDSVVGYDEDWREVFKIANIRDWAAVKLVRGEWDKSTPARIETAEADIDYLDMETEALDADVETLDTETAVLAAGAELTRADVDYCLMLLGESDGTL